MILQQDAFDEVDSVTPMERQEEILNMVIDICHTEFKFDTFIEVMDYFKKMINLCKQMNYAKYKSEQYEDFKKQLQELVALVIWLILVYIFLKCFCCHLYSL